MKWFWQRGCFGKSRSCLYDRTIFSFIYT